MSSTDSSNNTNANTATTSSTVKSYIDQATGMVQRAAGSLTGDSPTHSTGTATQSQGEAEHAASQNNFTKLGPVTADPATGATATDHPQRSNGSWDQTVGSAKESLGNLIGNEGLRKAGQEQNAAGKQAEAEGQVRDWQEGVKGRAKGAVGKVAAAATGDDEEEQKWRDIHDEGKVRERGVEQEVQKRY
ncbi:hypothetical protein AbraIFM66950_000021 [Aspergillus brasiliensis]|nr:hypothetical protein AbraIFM66950_000021 [Aspergillus brasiliensis]